MLNECVKARILLVCTSDTIATVAIAFFFFFLFSLPFVLFFLLNIYKNLHIYCYTDTTNFTIFLYNKSGYVAIVLQHCASKVLTLCSTIATTVFLFFPSNRFVLFFFLLNIDVSWHLYCYTDTTNFTIISQLLTCQFLTSRNKIIKYETMTNHNWK